MVLRILLASDIHGSEHAIPIIHTAIDGMSPDIFVACGDITNFGPTTFAIDLLRNISIKTFAVPGNCDPPELVEGLEALGVNLHGKKAEFGGMVFVGLGGSNPPPFDTMFELSEEEIARTLEPIMEKWAILISHPPPLGLCDVAGDGSHAGSSAVRKIVDRFQPRLVLTGHIHEARGVHKGKTTVVNPGMAASGYLALIDMDGELEVKLL
jgi:Icc-related predicted phosphoesterase